MAKYRILSLDGGGSWALIQVMALQVLYGPNTKGHDVLKDFDLVAANSGGSITLGGLVENFSLDQLLNEYFLSQEKRDEIFSELGFFEKNPLAQIAGMSPQYSTKRKFDGLQHTVPKSSTLKMSPLPDYVRASVGKSPDFLICGFDYDRRREKYFRSNLKSNAASFSKPIDRTLVEAIHASSTPPVKYFDTPADISPFRFWDGAIGGCNNPVLVAVVEALANRLSPSDIQVLSIGTGTVILPLSNNQDDGGGLLQPRQDQGIVADLKELAGSILDDPPDAATFIAHVALGQALPNPNGPVSVSGSVIRMNPVVRPFKKANGGWVAPEGLSETFADLAKLELDAVKQEDVLKIQELGRLWIADKVLNQPIRADLEKFSAEIGHVKFSAAKAAWEQLKAQP